MHSLPTIRPIIRRNGGIQIYGQFRYVQVVDIIDLIEEVPKLSNFARR